MEPRRPPVRFNHGRETLAAAEQRLRRLEELLLLRGEQRGSADQATPSDAGSDWSETPAQGGITRRLERQLGQERRQGFSLIELIVVLLVIMILVGMSLGTFAASLRRAAVSATANDIVTASDQARQLALLNKDEDLVYGVRLLDDPDTREARCELVVLEGGGVSVAQNDRGEPIYRATIPDSVIVWQGDYDLREGDGELIWFFANETGAVHKHLGGGRLSTYPITVGTSAPQIDSAWGLQANTGIVDTIAPSTADNPGLSVRSTDGSVRRRIGVHATGIAFSTDVSEVN